MGWFCLYVDFPIGWVAGVGQRGYVCTALANDVDAIKSDTSRSIFTLTPPLGVD